MNYIPPENIVLPLPVQISLPTTFTGSTLAPPVRSDPVVPLKATTASDLTSPPTNRFPQQTPVPPNPYPIVLPPTGIPSLPQIAG